MKICVVGGGNIGSLIAGELAGVDGYEVALLASKADKFGTHIEVRYPDGSAIVTEPTLITSDVSAAVGGADVVLVTLPANVLPSFVERAKPHLKPGAYLGVIPGSGGVEFCLAPLQDQGVKVFGFERVPSIARILEYGRVVQNLGRKDRLRVGALDASVAKAAAGLVESLFGVPCEAYPNYLNVTFIPSNQILHTARIYRLFGLTDSNRGVESPILFYRDWDNESSEALIACDAELQAICKAMPELDLSGVRSLLDHYEVSGAESMTHKIRSIPAFHAIELPMIQDRGAFYPDLEDRYFTTDFQHGLCVIKGFASVLDVSTPMIDTVLRWYEEFMGVEYFVNGKFNGSDLKDLPVPMNSNIQAKSDILDFYGQ